MKQIISPLRGTRDFYPEDKTRHQWLYQKFRQVSASFGYLEYEVPYLEKLELYAAKSGEELVKQQAFVFLDKSGEEIVLRPELTPSLARMVAQRQNELTFPLRWWAYGPIWRYEKPGKGRSREFFQWNIDLIGANSPEADAEMVAICAVLFKSLGLKPEQVQILVSDRRLTTSALIEMEIPETLHGKVFKLIDKLDKLPADSWKEYGETIGLKTDKISHLKSFLMDNSRWQKSPGLVRFFKALDILGVGEYVRFDPKIVRGLDYYTGIVFEAYDLDGGRAIMGGGRYDNLVEDVGGEPLPSVGFAMGDVMLSIVLEKYNLLPILELHNKTVLMTVFSDELIESSINFATQLRDNGIEVISYPEVEKLQKQLKFADRMKIHFAVIIGPDELENQTVVIKDLINHTQEVVKRDSAVNKIQKLLAK
jgi:histidyl-tRNA synthetase